MERVRRLPAPVIVVVVVVVDVARFLSGAEEEGVKVPDHIRVLQCLQQPHLGVR
jgi:hypothetical protein